MESSITSKGQATIPKAIRDHLGVRPGDRLKFFVHADGSVVLLPIRPSKALRGLIAQRKPPVSIAEMNEATHSRALARTRRDPK